MKIIPFTPSLSAIQEFNVNLGKLVCNFVFSWNIRAQSWYCNFKTSEGENNSVRMVENTALLGSYNALGLDGEFRVLKFEKNSKESINYDNFGQTWKLVFATNSEWEEFLR